jgi:23S rRNA pseudouridine1911/1915/1917 synthase
VPDREETIVADADDDGRRIDAFLAARLPDLSRSFIQRLSREGHVRLDGRIARSSARVRPAQVVTISIPAPAPARLLPEAIPLAVLHEDDAILVISKPAGMVVHPGAGVRSGTLVHALLARGPGWSSIGGEERPGIVHRLDRGTSGVMVVARTDRAHRNLAAQFKDRTVEKTYVALVWGDVPDERFTVDEPLGRDSKLRKRISTRTGKPREATTRFRVVERLPGFTLLEARPLTGRTHQIRAHLKSVNHPIVGDVEYGGGSRSRPAPPEAREAIDSLSRIALHARRLSFRHPVDGKPMTFEAEIPEEIERLIATLRRGRTPPQRGQTGSWSRRDGVS